MPSQDPSAPVPADPSGGSAPSDRVRVRRLPERGAYDRETVDAILREGLLCHVAFAIDGQPYVIPMTYALIDGRLILHGSKASRLLRTLASGVSACLSVTLLDGLVLARSGFHHSMNFRSVVAFGRARPIEGDEKRRALDDLVEFLIPGRTEHARGPDERELRATEVLVFEIEEASAKVRAGPPGDEPEDLALPIWAGVIPLTQVPGAPEPDEFVPADVPCPDYVSRYRRPTA